MRLALVTGLAEMLTVAAIRDATPDLGPVALCFHGTAISVSEPLRLQSLADAALFGPWEAVIDGLGREPAEVLDGLEPSMLLFDNLGGGFEGATAALFPAARIELFDNGLISHLSLEVVDGAPRNKREVPRALLARTGRAWFTLKGDLPRPRHLGDVRIAPVGTEALRGAARSALARMAPEDRPMEGPPCRLILGTAFYRTPAISFEDERGVYRRLVEDLRAESAVPILYKEHPRANRAPLLTEADSVEIVASRAPVELWAEVRTILEAYSISSTALLTLRKAYGAHVAVVGADIPFPRSRGHIDLLRSVVPAR